MKKQRFWLYCRAGVFYLHDSQTGQRESLHTRSKREAERTRLARNEAVANPQVGMALARSLLSVHDPKISSRTWHEVMEEFCRRGKPQTQARRRRAVSRAPLSLLRDKKLIESTADEFMGVLRQGARWRRLRCAAAKPRHGTGLAAMAGAAQQALADGAKGCETRRHLGGTPAHSRR